MRLKNLDGNIIVLGGVYPKIEPKNKYYLVKTAGNFFKAPE